MSLFQAVFDGALDAMLLADDGGRFLDANPAACELFGAPKEAIVQRSLDELACDVGEPHDEEGLLSIVRPDGARRVAEHSSTSVLPGLHLTVLRDVTERHEGARRCRLLASIVEASHDAIVSTDLDGTITSWNSAAERIFGYASAEAVGRNVRMLFPAGTAESLTAFADHETVRVRKDGSLVDVLVTVSPVRDAHGNVVGAARIAHDLTTRRATQVALRDTEQQLQRAQKLEAIGQLAGSVAHDFNNLLSVILSYGEMLLSELPAEDPSRDAIAEIRDAGRRAAELTRQLLAFSRKQVLEPRALDLSGCVRGMERMIGRLVGETIAVELELGADLPPVHADPGQMEQVVLNLVVNARDAMLERGGRLSIQTSVERGGREVVLAIRDDGEGMDAATRERAFEPFFTTKEPGRGTGLGLSTVYGIVKQSGGSVDIESEVGGGTCVRVRLPSHEGAADASQPPAPAESVHGTETVLLVEDDAHVRSAMGGILRRHGYRVLDATDGVDALDVFDRHGPTVDLLVTDVVMPRMSGGALARRLSSVHPRLRVLFVSGYSEAPLGAHLQKPVTPKSLLSKVRDVLR